MKRLKQLGKDSVVYGVGGILARSIGFLVLPIYTRIFNPAEFGVIEMLMVLSGFLSTFIVLGLDSAQSFYFFKEKENGPRSQAEVISSILQWRLSVGLLILLAAIGISPVLNEQFFDPKLSIGFFIVTFGGAFFVQILQQTAEVFRLLYRPFAYVGIELARSLLTAGIIIGLVVGFDTGIYGYVVGIAVAGFVLAVAGCWSIREYLLFDRLYTCWWPRLLKFGLPLVPAAFGMYLMNSTDRWFLQRYGGPEDVGIYAMGAKFAVALGLAVQTFRKAWWPIALDAMHSDDGPVVFRQISMIYLGFGMAGVVYLAYLAPWIVRIFTTPDYYDSSYIVGVLGFQAVFYGFYLIGAVGLWKKERTYYAAFLTTGGAILNIALNIVLVPRFGGVGAAIATALSFFAWCAVTLFVSERLWRVGFPVYSMGLIVLLGGLGVAAITVMYSRDDSFLLVSLVAHVVPFAMLFPVSRSPMVRQLLSSFRAKLSKSS